MKQVSRKHTADAAQGFTLIEIVITIVILGAVAGILVPFFNALVHSPDPAIRERAISLGQAMMDEIMAKRWDENTSMGGGPLATTESARGAAPATPVASLGVDAGENRTTYNDVDDYNGINEATDFTDQNGAAFVLTGYNRQVAVCYIASNTDPIDHNPASCSGAMTDTKRVVVTTTSPRGEVFNFVAVACNI